MGLARMLVLFCWSWTISKSMADTYGMEAYIWHHQIKKTYCGLIQKERVYRMENLEIYCAAKVKFFLNQVSPAAF